MMRSAIDGRRIALLSTWSRVSFLRVLPLRILFRQSSSVFEPTVTTTSLDRLCRRGRFGFNSGCDGGRGMRMVPAAAQHGMEGNDRGNGDGNNCTHNTPERFPYCPQLSAGQAYGLTIFD